MEQPSNVVSVGQQKRPAAKRRAAATPRTGLNARTWRNAFLAALEQTANISLACRAANITRSTAYIFREQSPEFAAQWAAAIETGIDLLEAAARSRAMAGSDKLLMFLLKAYRPEKFRDSTTVKRTGPSGGPVKGETLTDLVRRVEKRKKGRGDEHF